MNALPFCLNRGLLIAVRTGVRVLSVSLDETHFRRASMNCQLVHNVGVIDLAGLETRVRQVINQLCVLARGATLDFTLRVGKVVVDSLYDGDLTAWRSRARKDYALRVLAASPDLPLSATALYRALAIYELSQRQPNAWQHLGVSHLRAVLGLPNETQNHLPHLRANPP